MKFIRKYVLSNFRWKALSVVFAVFLWFFCMNMTSDAELSYVLSVPLQIVGDEQFAAEDMLLQNKTAVSNTYIRVSVKGKRGDIDALGRDKSIRDKFVAYVDLSLMELRYAKELGAAIPTQVFLSKPAEYTVVEKSPETVSVILEKYTRSEKELTVHTTGKTADGYTSLPKEVEPITVDVTGPLSLVSKVSEVAVTVSVQGAVSAVTETVTPVALDFEGNEVADVTISPKELEVTVPIYKLAKIPINKPEYRGEPPEGYVVTGIDWNPKYAEVMGTEEELAAQDPIALMPLEGIGEMTANAKESYDLLAYLPMNIQIVNGTQREIVVDIFIEPEETKTVEIAGDEIRFIGTAPGDFSPELILVEVIGARSLIEELDVSKISLVAETSELEPGEHEITVGVNLPAGVKLAGEAPRIIVVIP
jgi:YbbR domain-containing protein